ncbi:uncharacterized protein LOC131063058 [Cryptomeria japonica]|uniref:uncharacterized protein LOC131063058 n=1 Tax=Cryptomeria japonica TaxID=3369 RepID=UPI0025AC71BB|nr:uncharacterized protein LOC131063058 [Cryptomeria japonica]
MLKKCAKIEWNEEPIKAFQEIKKAIKIAPVLKTPDYGKPMQIFSFASFHTVVVVLLQKNSESFEQPIAFFSKYLQATDLKYDLNEKQSYALVKAIKAFRSYLMGATVVTYVPSYAIKDIFTRLEVSGRRCRWINRIQEFNIDIQITKLVRGQGLVKLMVQSNLDANQINIVKEEHKSCIYEMDGCKWYDDIIYYLQRMKSPEDVSDNKRRTLKLHAIKYAIVNGKLWWRNNDGVMLKCVDQDQAQKLLFELHSGVCGEHYMAKKTTHKVLRVGFWWPTIFKDAHQLVKKCDPCQTFSRKLKFSRNLPLRPINVQDPFRRWGIDFIGEIACKSSGAHFWILVATNYFTKWVEAIPTRKETSGNSSSNGGSGQIDGAGQMGEKDKPLDILQADGTLPENNVGPGNAVGRSSPREAVCEIGQETRKW